MTNKNSEKIIETKKIVYSFNPETMELIGSSIAYASPLEKNVFLLPAYSTEKVPVPEEGKITKWDGAQWFNKKIDLPIENPPTLVKLKETKINELNQKISSKIYKEYSIQKQINIGNRIAEYTDSDFDKMNAFITPILQEKNRLKKAINSCECFEELETISFEEIDNA